MKRRPRRNHSAAFKAKVAIAAIKGDQTIAEIAEQYDVHTNQVTTWKAQLEGGAADVFGNGSGAARRNHTLTQVKRISSCHACWPPPPACSVNHDLGPAGNPPRDSLSREHALAHSPRVCVRS